MIPHTIETAGSKITSHKTNICTVNKVYYKNLDFVAEIYLKLLQSKQKKENPFSSAQCHKNPQLEFNHANAPKLQKTYKSSTHNNVVADGLGPTAFTTSMTFIKMIICFKLILVTIFFVIKCT